PRTPRRGAAPGMDDVDADAPNQSRQCSGVAADQERIFRGKREGQMHCARADNVPFHWAAGGGDVGGPTPCNQSPSQLDRARLGTTRDEARDDLQYRRGTAFWRSGPGVIVDTHSTRRKILRWGSLGILTRLDGATIAYHRLAGRGPGVVFLGGFRS